MKTLGRGIDIVGWVQASEPPSMHLPRKENPRRPSESGNCSVRSAYCSRGIGREPNIRLANSCGSLAKLDELDKVKTHLDNFKEREKERHKADKRRKRQEQRVVDLLTVKAALSVLRETCWYWGAITGSRAAELLSQCSPGTFLLRDSSDRRYLFSLSIMTVQGPTSVRLLFSKGCFRLESSGVLSPRSPCIVSLIIRMAYLARNTSASKKTISEEQSTTEIFASMSIGLPQKRSKPSLLEKPLFVKVPSLAHMSRLAINRYNLRHYCDKQSLEYVKQYPYSV